MIFSPLVGYEKTYFWYAKRIKTLRRSTSGVCDKKDVW
jgi:hypothetical protein